jgi:hypothetical protein
MRMKRKLPEVAVVQTIASQIELMTGQMEASLVQQLQSDLALADCLNVVAHLRALHVLSEPELKVLFLQARNVFLEKALAVPTADPYRYLTELIDASRRHMFNIITQYRAVFSASMPSTATRTQARDDEEGASPDVLHDWALYRVRCHTWVDVWPFPCSFTAPVACAGYRPLGCLPAALASPHGPDERGPQPHHGKGNRGARNSPPTGPCSF